MARDQHPMAPACPKQHIAQLTVAGTINARMLSPKTSAPEPARLPPPHTRSEQKRGKRLSAEQLEAATEMGCPHCGSAAVRRSMRCWYERLWTLVSRKRPYRCIQCGRRFWLHASLQLSPLSY